MTLYFVAIVLPQALDEKIQEFKTFMLENYNCKVGLKSPAHITLIPPFFMHPANEESLLQQLDDLCDNLSPFTITTQHFAAFKPRTLFVDVAPTIELQQLKKRVNTFLKTHAQYGAKIESRPFHPHITIATRDLTKEAFYDVWQRFKEEQFAHSFTATGMATLRHNQKNWDVIHTSQFQV